MSSPSGAHDSLQYIISNDSKLLTVNFRRLTVNIHFGVENVRSTSTDVSGAYLKYFKYLKYQQIPCLFQARLCLFPFHSEGPQYTTSCENRDLCLVFSIISNFMLTASAASQDA